MHFVGEVEIEGGREGWRDTFQKQLSTTWGGGGRERERARVRERESVREAET